MDMKIIKKYDKYNMKSLKRQAKAACHKYIRERDAGKPCISCSKPTFEHAGHFYKSELYSLIRYHENNIHGQCVRCNHFLNGNEGMYRKNILNRISEQELEELDYLAAMSKKTAIKRTRLDYILIIEKYKKKLKEL
jgi:hypothetical protein